MRRQMAILFAAALLLGACGAENGSVTDTAASEERAAGEGDLESSVGNAQGEAVGADGSEAASTQTTNAGEARANATGNTAGADKTSDADSVADADNTANGDKSTGETEKNSTADPRLADRPYANNGTGTVKVLEEGDVAPDFMLPTNDGGTFRLSEHDDEVVLINFWATWCPPCVEELPAFERLNAEGNAVIIGVDCGEDKATVDSFIEANGYTYPIAYDEEYVAEDYYPTDGIPYTLVIDKGIIHEIWLGSYGAEQMYNEYGASIAECMQ